MFEKVMLRNSMALNVKSAEHKIISICDRFQFVIVNINLTASIENNNNYNNNQQIKTYNHNISTLNE